VENPDIGIQNNDYDMPEGGNLNLEEEQVTRNQRQKKAAEKTIRNLKAEINTLNNTIQSIFTTDQLK
jgi:hypothetical protein